MDMQNKSRKDSIQSVGDKLALRQTLQAFCKQVNILSQKSNNFKNTCVYRASPELLHKSQLMLLHTLHDAAGEAPHAVKRQSISTLRGTVMAGRGLP